MNGAPVRFQKAVPGSKENAAVGRREARRSALWIGSSLPLEGQVRSQDGPTGAAFRAREFRRSASLFIRSAKGSKPTIWTEARRDAPRGSAPARFKQIHRERTMSKLLNQTLAGARDARWLRFARNDVDGVIGKQPPSLRGARRATKQSPLRGWHSTPQGGTVMSATRY